MTFDKPIAVQTINEDDEWSTLWKLHAHINKVTGDEFNDAGAKRSVETLNFEVRYFKAIDQLRTNTQFFRIVYHGRVYNISDYDDYMERHQTVKIQAQFQEEATDDEQ